MEEGELYQTCLPQAEHIRFQGNEILLDKVGLDIHIQGDSPHLSHKPGGFLERKLDILLAQKKL